MRFARILLFVIGVIAVPGMAGAQKSGGSGAGAAHAQQLYNRAIATGTHALQAGRFDAAFQAFQQAKLILPGNAQAVQNANRLAQGALAMQTGVQALAAKHYKQSVDAFTLAVGLLQGMPVASQRLAQARHAALTAYRQAMQTGTKALSGQQLLTAIQAFGLALQIVPGDPAATKGLATASHVPIDKAIAQGLVAVTGHDLATLSLHSKVPVPLRVSIPAGSTFLAQGGGAQNMVALAAYPALVVPAGGYAGVGVACVNMRLATPGANTMLLPGPFAQGDLQKLLSCKAFLTMGFRVQQFAVWTITDNPPRNGYRGIRNGILIIGTPASDDEIQWVGTLLQKSGISPQNYLAFQK